MVLDWKGILAIGAVLGIAGYLAKKQIAQTAQEVGTAINPVSDQNIFYQGASAVANAVTNNTESLPLGSQIYDWINPNP